MRDTGAAYVVPEHQGSEIGQNFRAAALLGLISSTFSTIATTLAAARIGQDAVTDWMVVAAIPFRDPMLQAQPSWGIIAVGIAFHQWADFFLAVASVGVLGRWTTRKPQRRLSCLSRCPGRP